MILYIAIIAIVAAFTIMALAINLKKVNASINEKTDKKIYHDLHNSSIDMVDSVDHDRSNKVL